MSNKKYIPYLLLLPGVITVSLLTLFGVLNGAFDSVTTSDGVSLEVYKTILQNDEVKMSIIHSLHCTVIATILSLVLGIIITRTLHYYMNKYTALMVIPMYLPHFVAGYLMYLVLSQTGLMASALYNMNQISAPADFPALVHDRYAVSIIASYVWKQVPFIVVMLLPVYDQINDKFKEVCGSLGANRVNTFINSELVMIIPSLIETGLILFVFVFTAYEIPALLGMTYPKAVPVLAYDWFYQSGFANQQEALALLTIMSVISLAITFTILIITSKLRYRVSKGSN